MEVGFIGLGAMGSAMARNLVAAGHIVRAWNRSGNPGVDGLEMVGEVGDTLKGDATFTMLSDDMAIREVALDTGVLSQAHPGVVHIITSTISVAFAEELSAAHAEAKVAYVAAPVLGRPNVAAAGALNILAAGDGKALAKVRPLLDVLGKKVWMMGSQPRQANAAKLAANMMISMAIEAMAEAVVITEANDLDRGSFFELILNTLFSGRSYQNYSANILNERYDPGFKARLGLKDLRLATAAAATAGRRLPMLEAVRERMNAAVDAGGGECDWSIMADYTLKKAAD
ncbi:NAD(P)-dependent oxidoreductase [Allopusillimonas soli]|uniref:NAD(P)-dependent oxidoreductase n=1 Tax=Allopusillimonas soli TaxID=659016 RepID=A0A853FB82_9BURK|nr:NAD(P)-dependent oxidoreductase [Allopusillimonas soli]NYT37353.1 NAD(P)-dependent oxidoreductase [Allopusillimonas soli]TEA74665.1 NAD(P)-dependent oxidoreductase [Allopusillimonas soli]